MQTDDLYSPPGRWGSRCRSAAPRCRSTKIVKNCRRLRRPPSPTRIAARRPMSPRVHVAPRPPAAPRALWPLAKTGQPPPATPHLRPVVLVLPLSVCLVCTPDASVHTRLRLYGTHPATAIERERERPLVASKKGKGARMFGARLCSNFGRFFVKWRRP